ncbi:RagB/SusD family nutrient uptake outer membrane protein [Tenacibaculum sp. UWU-22]|uniref:RagB/SusD family nutrient uptake outer membrane protein n=1 Tax=Tenacibaculum sp. UWU-22 TaxID=3234187 RepID=UPI0034DAF07D
MMKVFIKFKQIGIALGLLALVSCNDFLDREPMNATYDGVYWTTQKEAEQAVAGAYASFREALLEARFLYWGEYPAQTFLGGSHSRVQPVYNGNFTNLYYRTDVFEWKQFYRAANWALTVQDRIKKMDTNLFDSPEMKNKLLGEAAFVQSLSYFYLTRIWGDVPLVKEILDDFAQLVTADGYVKGKRRSPEAEVLQYALDKANEAVSLLEYSTPEAADWAIRANKASAQALEAHIAVRYASRIDDEAKKHELLTEAVKATTDVINLSNAELIDYTADDDAEGGAAGVELMCKGQSKTGLFEIYIGTALSESFLMTSNLSSHISLVSPEPYRASGISNVLKYYKNNYGNDMMFKDDIRANDARRKLFFNLYPDPKSQDPNQPGPGGDASSFESTYNAEFGLTKYLYSTQDPNASASDLTSNVPKTLFSESNILIFRLADIYLLRAEANLDLGEDSGVIIPDIDAIREKARVPSYDTTAEGDDSESLKKAIFDERAIEFVGEGQIAYDRLRMKYFDGLNYYSAARLNEGGFFWPISRDLISANPILTQTPYWQGKI